MSRAWYVLHTIAGLESNVVEKVKRLSEKDENIRKVIVNIKVPTEVVEVKGKDDKKHSKKQRIFPGYILMELDLPSEERSLEYFLRSIKNIHGVIGFLGAKYEQSGVRSYKVPPKPLSIEEVRAIFERTGEFKSRAFVDLSSSFEVGNQVKITDGPFKGLVGTVVEVYPDKFKLKVNVTIFNRETPLNINFDQVERL
ncbi:MAG: transcription termination/antitermination protein NusG [Spirochaetia bacterium]|nr:transcription termination/antitermination protein NusG [Spirochaetota bacterium]MCX8096855.1 transcription termination/antitermination protein NusG [Spirochaetota bacterium]MDW8111789.1 transcription termination/antitermination protein NusG [Spirochaetia bacterium]